MTRSADTPPISAPSDLLWFGSDGLHIGPALVEADLSALAKSRSPGRIETLLAIAFRTRLTTSQWQAVVSAAAISRSGDHGLANIRLATSNLILIPLASDLADRLALADSAMSQGLDPGDLLRELGFGGRSEGLKKYNEDELRVPAGNGIQSGRFASGGETQAADAVASQQTISGRVKVASAAIALSVVDGPSFLAAGVSPEALVGLGALAATLGLAAAFGTIFVPTPNSTSSSGPLPGGQGLSYSYDHDEGVIRLRDSDGNIVAAGPRDESGIFHDADTGIAIGRDIGGTLVFEQASMMAVPQSGTAISQSDAGARTANDNLPRLCPDPVTERDNKASARAQAYQEQISAMVNPQRPLPYGLAIAFFNPITGKWVKPDDCDQKDGSLIEAKGPGFARNLKYDFLRDSYLEDFVNQARAQVQAAGSRSVIWYFAERETANAAAKAFANQSDLAGRIKVRYVEAIVK